MEKLYIIFMLAMSVRPSRICKAVEPKLKTFDNVQYCIAQCLDLPGTKKICKYSETTGNVLGEKCEAKFYPAKRNKVLACYPWVPINPHLKQFDADGLEVYITKNRNNAEMCDFLFYALTKYDVNNTRLVLTELTDFHFKLFRDARQIGTKLVLTLGSYGDDNMSPKGFMAALVTENTRAEFLNQIISVVKKLKFDGVAFHWFYPGCPQPGKCMFKRDKDRITGLANEVLRPLREMGLTTFYLYTLDMDISMYLTDYFTEIMPHVDYFLPETASQTGHWRSIIEFDNNLTLSIDALTKMASKIADKEFLSKNLYQVIARGMQYEVLDAKKAGVKSLINKLTNLTQEPSVEEFCQKLTSPNFTHVRKASEQNFAYSGKTVIVYDGIESLRAKADFAREKMAGMAVYQLHCDDVLNQCGCGQSPYLRTVAEVLKGRDCTLKPCF